MQELLLGVLTSTLGRHVNQCAFQQLQQALLYAFSRHVTRNGRILRLTGDLVDFIDKNDASLSLRDIIVTVLQQARKQGFNIFAHVARLGKCRSIHDGKGHLEHLSDRTCQQRLTRTGRTYQQDIRLLDLHLVLVLRLQQALIVVIYRYRQVFLGFLLSDNIQVEELLDILRTRQGLQAQAKVGCGLTGRTRGLGLRFGCLLLLHRFHQQQMTGLDTVRTDITAILAGEQVHVVTSTKTTFRFLSHRYLRVYTRSIIP